MLTLFFNRKNRRGRGASIRAQKKSSPLQEQMLVLKKVVLGVLLCSLLV